MRMALAKHLALGMSVNTKLLRGHRVSMCWRHLICASVVPQRSQHIHTNYFSDSPLDRVAHRRSDTAWLKSTACSNAARFLLFHQGQPVMVPAESTSDSVGGMRLLDVDHEKMCRILGQQTVPLESLVLLGCAKDHTPASHITSGKVFFAVDVSDLDRKQVCASAHAQAETKKNPIFLLQLTPTDAAMTAQARTLLDWHRRYRYCPSCGSTTHASNAGYKKVCDNQSCSTHKGVYNTSYPRVDPTVITLVVSPDQQQCLLGRAKGFPPSMYSCLAGFVEPGESAEDACIREVKEEVGVDVDRIVYHSSQPWPMPGSLMLGLTAHAKDTNIMLDQEELEDARWFSAKDVKEMLAGGMGEEGIFVPPAQAIAHQLLSTWAQSYLHV